MFDKNTQKIIFLLLAIISTSLWLTSISYSQYWGLNWTIMKSEPFFIHYMGKNDATASKILKALESFHPRMSTEIGYKGKAPIGVFLCNSQKLFNYITGKSLPKWSEGVALPANKIMIINASTNKSDPRKTAIHELTHILLNSAVNEKPIPRWFNEGLAVYYSNEKEFASSSLISKALITNSIIPLTDIDEVLSFNTSKAQLAYQESYLAVIFLTEKFGVNSIKKVIKALASEENEDQALLNAIGMDLWDFESEWIKYIKHKYRWHFLIEFDSYLWILILFLFIVGFILMRRRNRKTLRRWEEEEMSEL